MTTNLKFGKLGYEEVKETKRKGKQMKASKKHFYTITELKELLQIDFNTLKKELKIDKNNPHVGMLFNIQVVKLGTRWHFPKKAIDRWIETGQLPASDEEVA